MWIIGRSPDTDLECFVGSVLGYVTFSSPYHYWSRHVHNGRIQPGTTTSVGNLSFLRGPQAALVFVVDRVGSLIYGGSGPRDSWQETLHNGSIVPHSEPWQIVRRVYLDGRGAMDKSKDDPGWCPITKPASTSSMI